MGYNISDYRQIHEPYGTLEEVENLIAELENTRRTLAHKSRHQPYLGAACMVQVLAQ